MSSVFNQFTELDMSKKILLGSAAALIGVVAFRSYFLAKKKSMYILYWKVHLL
jgi:hypothetical protein